MTDKLLFPVEINERVKNGMGCGSQIGEGWFNLVKQLDSDIAAIAPEYKVDQVKEKFGGLRYYVSGISSENLDSVQDLIGIAEKASANICDVCGEPCNIDVYDYFIAARCEKHVPSRNV